MKWVKQHIASLLLIGIFFLPNFLNIYHFVWVDHLAKNSICQKEINIQNQNPKNHNCEQFFFKVPSSESLDLSYKYLIKPKKIPLTVKERIKVFVYKINANKGFYLRGPPINLII